MDESHYDICLFYSDRDEDKALWFRELLVKFVRLSYTDAAGERREVQTRIVMLGRPGDLPEAATVATHINMAVERSQFVFLYVTDHFLLDPATRYQGDAATNMMIEACQDEAEPTINGILRGEIMTRLETIKLPIPIFTKHKKDFRYPPELKTIRGTKGFEIQNILNDLGRWPVDQLTKQEVDRSNKYFLSDVISRLEGTLEKRLVSSGEISSNLRWASHIRRPTPGAEEPCHDSRDVSGTVRPSQDSRQSTGAVGPCNDSRQSSGAVGPCNDSRQSSGTVRPCHDSSQSTGTVGPSQDSRQSTRAVGPCNDSRQSTGTVGPCHDSRQSGTVRPSQDSRQSSGAVGPCNDSRQSSGTVGPSQDSRQSTGAVAQCSCCRPHHNREAGDRPVPGQYTRVAGADQPPGFERSPTHPHPWQNGATYLTNTTLEGCSIVHSLSIDPPSVGLTIKEDVWPPTTMDLTSVGHPGDEPSFEGRGDVEPTPPGGASSDEAGRVRPPIQLYNPSGRADHYAYEPPGGATEGVDQRAARSHRGGPYVCAVTDTAGDRQMLVPTGAPLRPATPRTDKSPQPGSQQDAR